MAPPPSLPPSPPLSATFVSFSELISISVVISPLKPFTERILFFAEFEKMKNGVTIVNTARGDLIERKLRFRRWSRARCGVLVWTVFDNEPHVDKRLLGSERVVVRPHIGAAMVEMVVSLTAESRLSVAFSVI
jgi:glyoxylate reductase